MTSIDTTVKHDREYPSMPVPKQKELNLLDKFELRPLHLLYLISIYNGDFDSRLHKGHFAQQEVFSIRIRELINMRLIAYDGQHCMTPRGTQHVMFLLEQKVQP